MLISHAGKVPRLDAGAWVAPDATLCGDVEIGPGVRILHGARIIAESMGKICVGANTTIMENAVVRATQDHPCSIGNNCIVGPNAHVVGATVAAEVFIATGAAVFHGAQLARGCEVRIHGTVHLRTRLEPGTVVPIGWVAVGDPAKILSPDKHDAIWELQAPLDFPGFVYGVDRSAPGTMVAITESVSNRLAGHACDLVIAK